MADIQRVVETYLKPQDRTSAVLVPEAEKNAVVAPAATEKQAGAIQRFELSNGLRLLVREDPRLPLVYLDAVFRGGLLAETPADNGLTKLPACC